jgi:ABC-type glycerol-3-phosphate transport system substrate-binding protein
MNVLRYLKTLLGGLFLAAVGAVLVFGPRDSGRSKAPPGFTDVTYWEKWTGNEGAQMQVIVDDFNRTVGREKHIYVKCLTISNIEERTLAATAAGVPPDVAGLTDEQIAQFAALDALEPLDDLDLAGHGITREAYKPVCWDGCVFEGHLWALPSTPAPVALHYNKRILQENAAALRAAGFDPEHIPTLLADFDRFARVLDRREGNGKILRSGYLAMEPGWFINFTPYWFGASYFDDATGKFTLTDPGVVQAFQWIRDYSVRYTPDAITQFQSGGSGSNSTQNPFLTGAIAMEQQGCWTANFIEDLAPALNRWQRFEREEPAMIAAGVTDRDERWRRFEDEIGAELRPLDAEQRRAALANKIAEESKLTIDQRRANYEWGAVAFPSAVPGLANATYTGFDALTIPRGARHKPEAFEFIAYVNRPDVTEKLNMMHCKISPLRKVSDHFMNHHPNPYIAVFEGLAASPNSHGVPRCPIWPEVVAEMNDTTQKIFLLEEEPAKALAEAQQRLQARLDQFNARQAKRRGRVQHDAGDPGRSS